MPHDPDVMKNTDQSFNSQFLAFLSGGFELNSFHLPDSRFHPAGAANLAKSSISDQCPLVNFGVEIFPLDVQLKHRHRMNFKT